MAVDFGPMTRRCVDKFGIVGTFTPNGGAGTPRDLTGVYDTEYFSDTVGIGIQTSKAAFHVVDTDVADAAARDLLTAGGTDYRIVEIKDDGLGVHTLVLNKR